MMKSLRLAETPGDLLSSVREGHHTHVPLTLGITFFILYIIFLFPAMPGIGDAADYSALVRQGVFNIRTPHIGYYIVAYLAVTVLKFLGFPDTLAFNLFAAICMAGAVTLSYQLFRGLDLDVNTAALASIILGTTGIWWYHAEFAELQAFLMLLIFLSFTLYLRGRSALSGIVFAAAMLTSSACLPSAMCFPFFAWRRRAWKPLIVFAMTTIISFATGVCPIAHDFFFGTRGIFPSLQYYPQGSPIKMLFYGVFRMIENHTIWIFPIAYGILFAWRRARRIVAFTGVMFIGHALLNLRLSHIEYGFAWMPAYSATSVLAAVGIVSFTNQIIYRKNKRTAFILAYTLIAASLAGSLYVWPKREAAKDIHNVIHQTYALVGESILLATPYVGFDYVYETHPDTASVWKSTWKNPYADGGAWRSLLQSRGKVYLLVVDDPAHVFWHLLFDNLEDVKSDIVDDVERMLPSHATMTRIRRWQGASLWEIRR